LQGEEEHEQWRQEVGRREEEGEGGGRNCTVGCAR